MGMYAGDEDCGDEITSPDTIEVRPCLNGCGEDVEVGADLFCSEECGEKYRRRAAAGARQLRADMRRMFSMPGTGRGR